MQSLIFPKVEDFTHPRGFIRRKGDARRAMMDMYILNLELSSIIAFSRCYTSDFAGSKRSLAYFNVQTTYKHSLNIHHVTRYRNRFVVGIAPILTHFA